MTDATSAVAAEAARVDWTAGRRAFLRTCGLAAAGAAALGVAGRPTAALAAPVSDADVLNFALNLEYLEAEFYLRATTGVGLDDSDTGGVGDKGGVKGGRKVKFDTKAIKLYAEEIAGDELAHVRFLRAGLGSAAVARPQINLKGSFTAAAKAAGLVKGDQEFDAFANETNFLLASFIFEDVGVTAYKGAAPLLTDKGLLEAAAGILGVEAYHAGIIRTLLFQMGQFEQAQAISDARDSLDGDSNLDKGIGDKKEADLVPTDKNGVAFSRSVPQVKAIVYLGGEAKGGFYPKGINGAFA
ncbi:ferritin-like domain-containing protein [Chelatococcus sambhunathii]|nr:ferritin-like domain-containing protein [Chelatococcus sambhunathii]